MIKKEMIAMLLAGGQGSRLGVLTSHLAKPAVSFGGKYKIIDFPLSNCINSGIDTVGVLTQYQPLRLNQHIGIGIPWDLDRNVGGVSILPPYEKKENTDWYTGTANAIYQNMEYMEYYHPDYVIILGGDHIYKMDYELMLEFHKKNNAQVTLATYEVPWEDASRFGLVITDENNQILEFEEKPENPRSNKASMGIYIFNWDVLKESLEALKDQPGCDFGMHVIPYCHEKGDKIMAYNYQGYWKDVGTLSAYWEANMELIDIIPEFNLYEEFWRIYTKTDVIQPQYFADTSKVSGCIVGEGTEVDGEIYNSVIGVGVTIEKGAVVSDSIIMNGAHIKAGAKISKSIIADNSVIGENTELGVFEEAPNKLNPKVYSGGLVTVGEGSVIPDNVKIGKNVAIAGHTSPEDYPDGVLQSGESIIRQ
ncbi:MAG: glucose-1-phosphate adenylyltransferase [Lachnospiraceae bacterium]|nr:glucose-1-phosphate adenylyltransferase [Lachnospiraceae bacterium]